MFSIPLATYSKDFDFFFNPIYYHILSILQYDGYTAILPIGMFVAHANGCLSPRHSTYPREAFCECLKWFDALNVVHCRRIYALYDIETLQIIKLFTHTHVSTIYIHCVKWHETVSFQLLKCIQFSSLFYYFFQFLIL